MRLLAAIIFVLTASSALAAPVIPFHDMIVGVIDDFARPKFAAFADRTAALRGKVAALCQAPSADALTAAQGGFRDTVLSFSAIEFVQMGPLKVDDRLERLLFWPDKKGIALRQVQQALASKDATAAAPETLRDKSVAMQGLAAVEFLLFGTGAEDLASANGSYRCNYTAAATTLIDGVAKTLSGEWADKAPGAASDAMLNPSPSSSDYRTELEVINKIAATLSLGNDTIRDQRLSPVLSLSTGTPKPRTALFWRSGMTAKALGANFTGLLDFFHAAKFGAALDPASAWVGQGIEFELKGAIEAANEVPTDTDLAVTDPEAMLGLKQMYIETGSLDTLNESLSQALGLSGGFSSLDGD